MNVAKGSHKKHHSHGGVTHPVQKDQDESDDESDLIDQSTLDEIGVDVLNNLIQKMEPMAMEARSQFQVMNKDIAFNIPDGYRFEEQCIKGNHFHSQQILYSDQKELKQKSTTLLRGKENHNDMESTVNMAEESSLHLFPLRVSPDKMSHHVQANQIDSFGIQPKTLLKKSTDVQREMQSTNDQTGITSQNSAFANLNPISKRQQSASYVQNQQNTSMQEDIAEEEDLISLPDTERGEHVKSKEVLQISDSQRHNAQQFQKQINRQNKILENQAFLTNSHIRKFVNNNNQMPTVVIETDSEDVATFKDRKQRGSIRAAGLFGGSIANMLNDQESILNMSVNYSKKDTQNLRNSQNNSSGDSGENAQRNSGQRQLYQQEKSSSSNTQQIVQTQTGKRASSGQRLTQGNESNFQYDLLNNFGLNEIEEDEEERKTLKMQRSRFTGPNNLDNKDRIHIDLASVHNDAQSSIFRKSEGLMSFIINEDDDVQPSLFTPTNQREMEQNMSRVIQSSSLTVL
ncbi:UNKNOWN [Stylonychia lemnae]|uniref:Uncharacterized protein n=1 Tax=Stylonychia lemnae TaxID=5949 RepID=A0A077ZVS5_STYLE|nr:UNKNOWN [Stylonychia lemnae]|eukprot:CDW73974.1 UNKNOWN [Stylonychia lemnae]